MCALVVLSIGMSMDVRASIKSFRATKPVSTTATTSTDWPISKVEASTTTTGWPASNLIDNNVNTRWSSKQYTDPDHTEWVAFWFDTYHSTNYITLYPRYSNSTSLAFPINFNIQYSDGSKWVDLYSFTAFPKPYADWIILPFGKTVTANGLRLNATKLGKDDYGYYYFQLGEVDGGYDAGFETLQFVGMDGPSGFNQFDSVGAGAFNPNKLKNWNYDYRQPLQTSTCSTKPNIYSHQAQWVANEQRWYLYYGGQDTVSGSTCDQSHDRIYMTVAEKNFQTISQETRRVIISEGQFHHVNNPALTRADNGIFAMVYTAAWDNPTEDWDYNRPGYATSSDGMYWTPSSPGDPYGTNSLITMSNYHSGDWSNAYINNANGLLYEDGKYWYYWGPEGLGGSDYRGYSTDMKNFTEEGAVSSNTYHTVNDLKRFHWNGQDYYLMVSHQNQAAIYSSLTTDPSSFPQESLLFNNIEAETEANDALDDYIVSAGLVTDGTRLQGVLYAASTTSSLNNNKLFAIWLQKKVYFNNSSVGWGSVERGDGPNALRLGLASTSSVETGTVTIYDTDGTTLLYTSPKMTIVSGMHWRFNGTVTDAQPCEPPASGDWTITQNCTWNTTIIVPANMSVKNNARVLVNKDAVLDIDLLNRALYIENGSKIDIENGGKIQ